MSNTVTVYIKAERISEVYSQDVFLSQVAKVWCSDKVIESKCKATKIVKIESAKEQKYVASMMKVIELVCQIDDRIEVTNIGEPEFVISYLPEPRKQGAWDYIKTALISIVIFFGAAFAIMTFNNDASVTELFKAFYESIMGEPHNGVTAIELGYSVGLPLGIIIFFNHFAKKKITLDPTPIEVQMRIYEDDINKALIKNANREESGIDIH